MSGEYPPPITIRDNCAVPEWTHNQAEPDSEAVALAHVACSTISVVCCAFVLLVVSGGPGTLRNVEARRHASELPRVACQCPRPRP